MPALKVLEPSVASRATRQIWVALRLRYDRFATQNASGRLKLEEARRSGPPH
jgi:hypothetical protein